MSEEYAPPLSSISPESVAEDISEFFIGAQAMRRPRRRRRVRHPARPVHHAAPRRAVYHPHVAPRPHPVPVRPVARPAPAWGRPATPGAGQAYEADEGDAQAYQDDAADDAYEQGADPDEGYDAFRDTAVGAARPARRRVVNEAEKYRTPPGWYRPKVDWLAQFEKFQGKKPEEGDKFQIAKLVSYAKSGVAAGNESTFELGHEMLGYYVRTGKFPGGKVRAKLSARAVGNVQNHVNAYHARHHGFFDSINPVKAIVSAAKWAGRAVGTVAHAAGAAIHEAADVMGHIPIVGGPLHDVLGAANPFAVIESIAKGERIDKAVLGDIKNKLAVVKAVAPYAATVASMVPGVGSGVAAALSTAAALASGRSITDAVVEGVKDAIPGGAAARAAFDTAVSLSKGNRIDHALLDAARSQIPAEARAAFDTGLAIAHGRNLQSVVVDGIKNAAPGVLGDLAKQGDKLVGASTLLAKVRDVVPLHEVQGFNLGMGVMSKSGVTPKALLAFRNRLQPNAQKGFDKALHTRTAQAKLHVKHVVKLAAAGVPGTLVIRSSDPRKNGRQVTGKWRKARPGQGVQGIVVQGRVKHLGWWNRAA